MLVRIWPKMSSDIVERWSRDLEGNWDTALKGSSALRAALLRATLNEMAAHLGIAHASLYADISKFYDAVDLWVAH